MIEKALRSILVNTAAVSAIVSTRIYQSKLPQNPTYPAIVFIKQGNDMINRLATDTDIAETRFDVIAASQTADATASLADEIRTALQRYKGSTAGTGFDGGATTILDCWVMNMDSDYESDLELYFSTVDIKIVHRLT